MLILLRYSTRHVSNIHKKIKMKTFMSSAMSVIHTIFYVSIYYGLFNVV